MKRYRIVIMPDPFPEVPEPIAGTIAVSLPPRPELILLDDSAAACYAGEHALVIRTNQPMGGWADERVIPWHRIIDYRQETVE